MSERTLVDEIITLIHSESNNNPPPRYCKIVKNYGEEPYSDVEVDDLGTLVHKRTFGNTNIGSEGIICFLNGELTQGIVIISDEFEIIKKLGLNQESSNKFNFAIIKKSDSYITYEEFWILSNAYYDYGAKRFVKIDETHTSFGIQIQANGSYPGEADLGYMDNTGINFWRNPKTSDVYKDTTNFDYSDVENKKYIGALRKSDDVWVEFGISSGWNNTFMIDSYGGMTIGGAGFEVDGNGIYPYTRLTSSAFTGSDGNSYYLLGLLDNAYHPTLYGWDVDSNVHYSWFVGLKSPSQAYLTKKTDETKFVVMYNDTPYNSSNTHELDVSKWNTVFEVSISSVKGIVNGNLTDLGASGGSSVEDSGWVNLTLTGNFYNFDSDNAVKYRKVGESVYITGLPVLNAYPSALSELVIGTLPSGFRPNREISCICELKDDAKLWTCTVKSNGEVTFNRLRDTSGFVAGTAFADVLKLNVNFLTN